MLKSSNQTNQTNQSGIFSENNALFIILLDLMHNTKFFFQQFSNTLVNTGLLAGKCFKN